MDAGELITPNLRLVRPLGRGAGGEVWLAEHLALDARVAVKFIARGAEAGPKRIARFQREASAAAQIKSPHVAQVLDHGVTREGACFIAMELLEGETLRSRIQRLGKLPPDEVALLVGQAARGLARAHRLGIVHRDVKPDNLFVLDLDGELFLKIIDFGAAKRELPSTGTPLTATGNLVGTPLYMSPEHFLSAKDVDQQADLWSLAVVTYEALTGCVPFDGATMGALALALHRGTFTPPGQLQPELPPALDAWMARAFQREPHRRFPSARDLSDALTHAVTPEIPRPPPLPSLGRKPLRFARRAGVPRTRAWLTTIQAALLLAAGSMAALVVQERAVDAPLPPMKALPLPLPEAPPLVDLPSQPTISGLEPTAHAPEQLTPALETSAQPPEPLAPALDLEPPTPSRDAPSPPPPPEPQEATGAALDEGSQPPSSAPARRKRTPAEQFGI
ncbi:serine/threonine-protein kinase [Chondromyces crocatus]|uniref:Protein kinase domain-containing protein n=1 Tax=Chondromyces crocatus TaxID=52 RepID=A0A0K1EDJ5_CHOCO|nr:serine/threonine-protein kinase [Chondromyces crocatus]AKT38924.1 uncharacterized protein CMC5_030710 [Chondromyces crocatus]